jgi:restriction system protein
MQREAARAPAARVRAEAEARREAEYARRAYLIGRGTTKEQKRPYSGKSVTELNADLEATVKALESILAAALKASALVSFSSLKKPVAPTVWRPPKLEPAPLPKFRQRQLGLADMEPFSPAGLDLRLDPRLARPLYRPSTRVAERYKQAKAAEQAKYEQAEAARQAKYEQVLSEYRVREEQLASARAEWQAAVNAGEIDTFEADYRRGDLDAIVSYCSLVLGLSRYPNGFPQEYKVAYLPESRQAIVEYELPTSEVVPTVKAYRYVKANNTIAESARPRSQIKALYASVVAQIAIRTLYELFRSDQGGYIGTVVFNGVVDTYDPGSGRRIRPCLVTVRVTRESFSELDLSRIEPLACLKYLSAGVSKSPTELLPVRPVLEFNMVDTRFVAETDALSQLDQRPNLMDLSFIEFEALIQNLFIKMGLEARQTRPSRDGGVDCVAWDPRPIFGGKVVIQAKRYKNTVGVSAVRDLFGTLQNEGANKGILVTTSGYGQASFDFAKNKPIELIDGSNLLYLLAEHTGIEAKIVPPDDWKDPVADAPEPKT